MGDDVFYIDGSNSMEVTQERAHLVLDRWSDYHNIVVLGLNDESTLGALEAARISGREEDVIGVGHGATMVGEAYQEINSRLIGSVGYFPERYGEHLIELARRILDGGSVPRENFIEHRVISHAGANS
jgi:ribose transport system substrate-binding protein